MSRHSDSEAPFLNLPDETLIEIVTKCGVEAVVHLEQTCKQLRVQIAQKSFWVALLRCLPNEQSPKLREDTPVETLDAGTLRKIVIGAVRRYKNWNGARPCVTHSSIIKLPGSGAARGPVVHASLLEDGLYVAVLWLSGTFEIRSASGGNLVWTYPLDNIDHDPAIETYAIDRVKDNGDVKFYILLTGRCQRTNRNGSFARTRSVKVFKLDLVSGESEQQFSHIIEVSAVALSATCQLRGRLAAVFDHRSAVILDWKTGEWFGLSKAWFESFELVDNYVVVFLRTLQSGLDECFFIAIIDAYQALQLLRREVLNGIIPENRVISLDARPTGSSPFMVCYEKISIRMGPGVYTWELRFACIRAMKAHWRRESAIEIHAFAIFFNGFDFGAPIEPCVLVKRKFTLVPPKGEGLLATVESRSEGEVYSSHNSSVKALLSPFPGRAFCISDHRGFWKDEVCFDDGSYSLHRTILDREGETADATRPSLSSCEECRVVCAVLHKYNCVPQAGSVEELRDYTEVPISTRMLNGFVYADSYSGAILMPLISFKLDAEGKTLEGEWSLKVAYFD